MADEELPNQVASSVNSSDQSSGSVSGSDSGDHSNKVSNQHKIFTSLIAGGVAGAVAKTTIAPFDRTKINFQVSNQKFSTRAALKFLVNTFRHEGVTSLWRGNTATMIRIIPYAAMQFTSHEQFKILLSKNQQTHLPPLERFLAGAFAGISATSATYPLDLIRARMAVTKRDAFQTVKEVFVKTYKSEGLTALYRGYVPTVIGVIPYAGISFFTYDTLKKMHTERLEGDITALHRMCYGAVAGVIVGRESSYKSILSTVLIITKEEGFFRGLYKGLSLNWIKGPIAVGTSFMTFETAVQFLRRFEVFHE